ncbi:hypothetical protein Hypma_002339 [Hypsizygus marmoreus]|uniref:Uncharacterized protein n=1 Tax=Hypsizygus marmoreus TaxID=39966 RepID=A0A369JDS1_HYPMA|nr:hypothetical protein Hypma_002339 [Hypsizygus marmoreus]
MYFARSVMAVTLFGVSSIAQASHFDTTNHITARDLISDFAYGVLAAREFADTYSPSPIMRRACGIGFGKNVGKQEDCTKEQYRSACTSSCNFMGRAAGGRGAGGADVGCHLACLTMKAKGTKG